MTEGKIVKIDEIIERYRSQTRYRNISEILNQPIIVTGVDFEERDIGTLTIIHTTTGDYYTFSEVLKDQMDKIKHYLENHKDVAGVELVIKKRKRYYYIDTPE